MAEYIKKDTIEKFIKDGLNNPDKSKAFGHDAIEILEEIHFSPAADVEEVVRCKDCANATSYCSGTGKKTYFCKADRHHKMVEALHSCSYGERREENGEYIVEYLDEEDTCKDCFHKETCDAWVRHGATLYDDYHYSVEGCPFHTPAADVEEVKHGRWDNNGRCTRCGGHAPYYAMASTYYKSPYCFECGAKMDGGKN